MLALGVSLLFSSSAAEGSPEAQWLALKQAWASDRTALAGQLLSKGEIGFADTQAGIASLLVGSSDPAVQAYSLARPKGKASSDKWVSASWKKYEEKRGALAKRHAKAAAALLSEDTPSGLASEIETWILRLDPDHPQVRKSRGEEKAGSLGWLPADAAGPLKKGWVRLQGVWAKPDPKGYASWKEGYEIPTEHFLVKSALPPSQILPMAADLEALWRIWAELFEGAHPLDQHHPSTPLTLWILRDRAEFSTCSNRRMDPRHFVPMHCDTDAREAFLDVVVDSSKTNLTLRGRLFTMGSELIHSLFQVRTGHYGKGYWCVKGAYQLMQGLPSSPVLDWDAAVQTQKHPIIRCTAFPEVHATLSPALLDLDESGWGSGDGLLYQCQSLAVAHYMMCADAGAYRRAFLEMVFTSYADKDADCFERCLPGIDREAFMSAAAAYAGTL